MARIFKPAKQNQRQEKAPASLTIESLSLEGRGVARHQNKTVFVSGALPGETVTVSHYRRHKRYSECETRAIVSASQLRVAPVCSAYARCGGCQLQHLDAHSQLDFKQQALLQQLEHQLGHKRFEVLPAISSAHAYRGRARIGVSKAGRLGFREKQSAELVDVANCPVLDRDLQSVWQNLQHWLEGCQRCPKLGHIELVRGDKSAAVVLRLLAPLDPEQSQSLRKAIPPGWDCWLQSSRGAGLTDLEGQQLDPRLSYALPDSDIELRFHPGDFIQVNREVNRKMVAQAIEWLQLGAEDSVLDLFCGIGNFTLPMARQAKKVVGIEAVETMVARGRENAEHNGLDNVYFKALDLEQAELADRLEKLGCNRFLLDPPRAGARQVCENGALNSMKRGVYVSCNPASFVRDAKALQAQGFQLRKLRVLDMFPHTAHMETMALFELD